MSRILVVDDEPRIVEFVSRGLRSRGYTVDCARSADHARGLVANRAYDLVILDLLMPGTDGVDYLQELEVSHPETQVLVLSSVVDHSRVQVLEFGASDDLAEPFALEELLARVRVRLREAGARGVDTDARCLSSIRLDVDRRTVSTATGTYDLPGREFLLLRHLLEAAGGVCSKEELLSAVWDYEHDAGSNVVDVYVGRLRSKLGADTIRTVRSVGYCLAS